MTTRVFTVGVTGCYECKFRMGAYCCHPSVSKPEISPDVRSDLFDTNCRELYPSCPMYQYSFVKDETK
jgi:hypothetical protein